MVSLDSANGPSDTTRFLPETILPSRSSGFPAMALPSSFNRLNHAIQLSAICCICSGERPLYQSVLRKISRYPFLFGVLIDFVSVVDGLFGLLTIGNLNQVFAAANGSSCSICRAQVSSGHSSPIGRTSMVVL